MFIWFLRTSEFVSYEPVNPFCILLLVTENRGRSLPLLVAGKATIELVWQTCFGCQSLPACGFMDFELAFSLFGGELRNMMEHVITLAAACRLVARSALCMA